MKFRIGIFALSLLLSGTRPFATPADSGAPGSTATATVLIWVRDSRGAPVPGLTADDFFITENGIRNRVLAVRNFTPGPNTAQASASIPASRRGPAGSTSAPLDDGAGGRMPTQVLMIMTPMGPRGRHDSLRDAIRLLKKPVVADWRLAFLDDEGTFIPFGQSAEQMRGMLEKLASRISAPQFQPLFGDHWSPKAARAIGELGALPGRHVIIFVSDYEGRQNPTLLHTGPQAFTGMAIGVQAAMYTVQGEGPAVAVPFGGAASPPSYFGSGQDVANAMVQDMVSLGVLRSDLLQAADETGGLPANDLEDAFKRIAADAAGNYLVTFEARPNTHEGSLHPFSIATRFSHVKIKGPRFYTTPHEPLAGPLPAEMMATLDVPADRTGLNVLAQAWLFPNQGSVHRAAFAADVRFKQGTPAPGSRVKFHAELVNESIGGIAETWYEEREWPAASSALPLHWQRESYLYPGSYVLRVTAMDTVSGKIARATDSFMARPLNVAAFRFSAIVLADGCLPQSEQQTMRRNLFDPLRWDGCKLAPAAAAHFRASQTPLLLLRVYPPDPKVAELVKKQWRAYAVVDDADDKAIELQISAAEVRGLTVTGKLPLAALNLRAGPHNLRVLFSVPGEKDNTQVLPLHTRFSIEP